MRKQRYTKTRVIRLTEKEDANLEALTEREDQNASDLIRLAIRALPRLLRKQE